jgi:hypothetical protein
VHHADDHLSIPFPHIDRKHAISRCRRRAPFLTVLFMALDAAFHHRIRRLQSPPMMSMSMSMSRLFALGTSSNFKAMVEKVFSLY